MVTEWQISGPGMADQWSRNGRLVGNEWHIGGQGDADSWQRAARLVAQERLATGESSEHGGLFSLNYAPVAAARSANFGFNSRSFALAPSWPSKPSEAPKALMLSTT